MEFIMKVILKADVKGTGKAGDMVNVSDGYARNFLFPKALATLVTPQVLNDLKIKNEAKAHHEELEKQEMLKLKAILDGKIIKITAKAGQGGKLFGSVTTKEIAEILSSQISTKIDKKNISLENEIKNCGSYSVTIKLSSKISATVTVVVSEE